jgi:peptidoglycan-associated lipoprotein
MRIALALAALVLVSGCKKDPPATPYVPQNTVSEAPPAPPAAVQELKRNFERVNFEFDSAVLTADAKRALAANAAILQAYPEITVEVQGHCDERGTIEYNLALGDRRARSVQEQLTLAGVSPSRIRVVTYGEERPLVSGHEDSVWSQNRRAEFRILSGQNDAVAGTI